jgi:hypothetical protein
MPRKPGYLFVAGLIVVALAVPAKADEVQLCGMRLGQHAINLLDIWGQPDGIVTGEGAEQPAPTAAQAPGAAGGAPMMTGPGAGMGGAAMGMPGAGGMGPMGGGMGGMGGPTGTPGMGGAPTGGMGGMGMGALAGGVAGGLAGAALGGGKGALAGAIGGAIGGAVGAAAGAGAAAAAPFPIWALPVWITLRGGEVEWIYQRGPVVMGFALDRDGYITVVAVAGRDCHYARSALWQPHRYVKLGDSFKRLLYRYGYPDDMSTYVAAGPAVGQNAVTVTFSGVTRTFTRDCVLRYQEHNNIAFTLHDFKVVRMHIWQK